MHYNTSLFAQRAANKETLKTIKTTTKKHQQSREAIRHPSTTSTMQAWVYQVA